MSQGQNRFVLNLQPGKTAEETASRCLQELIRLVGQLNAANLPVSVGPGQSLPEGMQVGQVVVDWSSGVSQIKVWDGFSLV